MKRHDLGCRVDLGSQINKLGGISSALAASCKHELMGSVHSHVYGSVVVPLDATVLNIIVLFDTQDMETL